jgi:hypothetical protein
MGETMMKTYSLAVLLATAALTGLVASSATATTLCEESVGFCPAGKRYALPTKFQAKLAAGTAFKVAMGMATVECNESEIAGETQKNLGPEMWIFSELGVWSLEHNGGQCVSGMAKCTTAEWALPMIPLWFSAGGNGSVLLRRFENPMSLELVCGGVKCIYTAESVEVEFRGGGPGEALLVANKNELKKAVGSNATCANEAFVSFEYAFKLPANALWIAYSP